MTSVSAKKLVQYADIVGDWNVTAVSAGPNGELLIISSEHNIPTHDERRRGASSGPRLTGARLHVVTSTGVRTVELPPIEGWYFTPQPLGPDRWLVRPSVRREHHLVVIEAGTIVGVIDPGDVPHHVETTRDGQIWLGYIDEAIMRGSDLASQGVVRLNSDGHPAFRLINHFRRLGDNTNIDDCYALNVVSDREAWVNFFNGQWNLLRIIDDDIVGFWRNIPIWTATGLAVAEGCVVLTRRYRDSIALYTGSPQSQKFRAWLPVDANRNVIRFTRGFGRGSHLFLATNDAVYAIDARELS